jgi:hypothetical protein
VDGQTYERREGWEIKRGDTVKFVCASCSILFDRPPTTAFSASLSIQGQPYRAEFGILPALWDSDHGPILCPSCVVKIIAQFLTSVTSGSTELKEAVKKEVSIDGYNHI